MQPLEISIRTPAAHANSNLQPPPQSLSAVERRDLEQYEAQIRKELGAFIRVGRALLEIKRRKLYRERFSSFETYCHVIWGWKRSQAYRMIDAAEVCVNLLPSTVRPQHERHVRPLVGLSPEKANKAWARVCEKSANGKITSAIVRRAVAETCENGGEDKPTKLDWQLRIKPLLKQAESLVDRGDKEEVERIVMRISLLLNVGEIGHRKEQPE